jgi:hypothetical protein
VRKCPPKKKLQPTLFAENGFFILYNPTNQIPFFQRESVLKFEINIMDSRLSKNHPRVEASKNEKKIENRGSFLKMPTGWVKMQNQKNQWVDDLNHEEMLGILFAIEKIGLFQKIRDPAGLD